MSLAISRCLLAQFLASKPDPSILTQVNFFCVFVCAVHAECERGKSGPLPHYVSWWRGGAITALIS